ncbi:platelet-activating factor acetylhydrolase, isoform II-domain-containing protein [Peziza echinospora]|nr:platelet-activating factor acetylhydrolase, isoform II-domain-containing protein [Peziza echinospora]
MSYFVPKFPPVPGKYEVGTLEIEIPVSSLLRAEGKGKSNNNAGFPNVVEVDVAGTKKTIETVLYRVYYPVAPPPTEKTEPAGPSWVEGAKGYYQHWWSRGNSTPPKQSQGEKKDASGGGEPSKGCAAASTTTKSTSVREVGKPVYWIPELHQKEYFKGYLRFGGLKKEWVMSAVSNMPNIFYHITISATASPPLVGSTEHNQNVGNLAERLPTMIFSHGLGGSRLAYSHICCAMASHGVVVIAPEHRDGSGPVSIINSAVPPSPTFPPTKSDEAAPATATATTTTTEPSLSTESAHTSTTTTTTTTTTTAIPYENIPHTLTPQMSLARDIQLSIRTRELSLIYTSLTEFLDRGILPEGSILHAGGSDGTGTSTPGGTTNKPETHKWSMFKNRLDIKEPGKVIFAGHSFGAATVVQFVKSVFYNNKHHQDAGSQQSSQPQRFRFPTGPATGTDLTAQITPKTPLLLLDLWCLSLLASPRAYWLWKLPLPQMTLGGENGNAVLGIMSQQFYIWKENMWAVKWILSRTPWARNGGVEEIFGRQGEHPPVEEASAEEREYNSAHSRGEKLKAEVERGNNPTLFYAPNSAHLSQSDFNILLPYMFKKKVPDAKGVMDANINACWKWLRGLREEVLPRDGRWEVEGLLRLGLEEETGAELGKTERKLNLEKERVGRGGVAEGGERAAEVVVQGEGDFDKDLTEG